MTDIIRHVAKVLSTDQRCLIAYMQIPGREDHALIVPMDNMPDRVEQAIMQVLRSPEGQQEETFANALHRHLMPNGGETILAALHNSGKLVAMPVNNIVMLPQPNKPVKLSLILEQLGRLPQKDSSPDKFNPHAHNQQANSSEQSRSIGRGLLMEAEMLEADAKRKREQAYNYDPGLRSQSGLTQQPQIMEPNPMVWPTVVDSGTKVDIGAKSDLSEFDTRLQKLEMLINRIVENKEEASEVVDDHRLDEEMER